MIVNDFYLLICWFYEMLKIVVKKKGTKSIKICLSRFYDKVELPW